MRREPPAKGKPRRVKFPDYEAPSKRARKSDETERNSPVDIWEDEDGLEDDEEEEEGDEEDEAS